MQKQNPIFETKSITKKYGPTIALNNVDISIYKGEIRGFIGENGSGKSTMAALMTGIHDVTSGSMFYHGKEWKPSSIINALDHGIGIVIQENGTIPQISVAENIFLGALDNFKGVNFFEEKKVENFSKYFDNDLTLEMDHVSKTAISEVEKLLEKGETAFYNHKRLISLIKKDNVLSKTDKKTRISELNKQIDDAKLVMKNNLKTLKNLRKKYGAELKQAFTVANLKLEKANTTTKQYYVEKYNATSKKHFNDLTKEIESINQKYTALYNNPKNAVITKRRHKNELNLATIAYKQKISILDKEYEMFSNVLKTDERSLLNRYKNFVNKINEKNELSFYIKTKNALLELVFGKFVNRNKLNKYAQLALSKIGVYHIISSIPCGAYDMQGRKLIEIAKCLNKNPEIFIVDETTTALSEVGRAILYNQMQVLKDNGKSVLFISHDLEEIKEKCDTLTVLRDGNIVATLDKSKNEFIDDDILKAMIGRKLDGSYYRDDYDGSYGDEVVLKMVDGIVAGKLKHVNVELHKGEILGIGGLSECGMRELGQALFGNIKMEGGFVYSGKNLENLITSEVVAMKNKIGYLPKNRDVQGLSQKDSIFNNIALASINNIAKLNIFVFKGSERKVVSKQIKDLSIKSNTPNDLVSTLSGGNKQKVSLAKWIGNESEILILDCPTRGVDIGVKQFIYQLMNEMKQEGKSILMISEELPELIGMSDRILIMKDGKINNEFIRSENLTQEQIIKYMI